MAAPASLWPPGPRGRNASPRRAKQNKLHPKSLSTRSSRTEKPTNKSLWRAQTSRSRYNSQVEPDTKSLPCICSVCCSWSDYFPSAESNPLIFTQFQQQQSSGLSSSFFPLRRSDSLLSEASGNNSLTQTKHRTSKLGPCQKITDNVNVIEWTKTGYNITLHVLKMEPCCNYHKWQNDGTVVPLRALFGGIISIPFFYCFLKKFTNMFLLSSTNPMKKM